MRLSKAKVEDLSARLVDCFAEIEGVMFQGNDAQIRMAAENIISDELMVEERLNAEVHKMLQSYKYEITMERMNYDELFKKIKNKLIAERKVVL
ncbi:MAG: DUF507 family protein [Chloroflexi bacterium AL-N10]|nr:DUF507 family protein [Chloroflexi bacterium AL-N1]NOK69864.1 DUF507 family protein [Chloroflexi bacterium AL-N10]NOK73839.1 DUF507 family protein [Chloroflexi bacterium AL-N5]NOK91597.1 DUF507 family protein [Chloroflexi bacterium AL-N15]